ncbi:MAG: hypothetical protein R3C97_13525 [Geminicoccaceae bacterium]
MGGLVWLMEGEGRLQDTAVLDLRPSILSQRQYFEEFGLLGFALNPGFAVDGRV